MLLVAGKLSKSTSDKPLGFMLASCMTVADAGCSAMTVSIAKALVDADRRDVPKSEPCVVELQQPQHHASTESTQMKTGNDRGPPQCCHTWCLPVCLCGFAEDAMMEAQPSTRAA